MRILVAGGGGFIGSHLAAHLGDAHEVTTLGTGANPAAAGIPHRRISATNPDFAAALAELRPQVCVDCIGAANPAGSFTDRDADFDLNVLKLRALLEAARRAAPGMRLVHLSSAAVYGDPPELPVREDHPTRPISPYGWHKLQAEAICREYADVGDVPTLSVRIFSAFGPGLRRQLLWDTALRARAGRHLSFAGTGDESRDFIFIADVVRAIARVIAAARFEGECINVASGEAMTIRDTVALLLRALDWRGEVAFSGVVRAGDPLNWQADITRLRALGFAPATPFAAGVERFAQWFGGLDLPAARPSGERAA